MYPVKTKDRKSEQNVNNEQGYREEEDVKNTTNTVFFTKQENQVKQDHNKDIINVVRALKKLYMSYNLDSVNYISDKFKDVIL